MWILVSFFVGITVYANEWDINDSCADLDKLPLGVASKPKIINVTGTGHLLSIGFEDHQPIPTNIKCSYMLVAPEGMHMRLRFNFLDIPASDRCETGVLLLLQYTKKGKPEQIKELCGSETISDYVSIANMFHIILFSDGYLTGRGFNITYSLQDNPDLCKAGELECRNRNCVSAQAACDGKDDCGDGTDEERCHMPPVEGFCGKPEIPPSYDEDRIVGGREAVPGSWPWMVDMQYIEYQFGHTCGGTLINSQWVLTAAHCFIEEGTRTPDAWRIHIGNHHKFHKDEYEQVRYPKRIIIYNDIPTDVFEENGEFDLNHDVALVKLNAPVQFSKHVLPACLPSPQSQLNSSFTCFATGWGMTRGTGGNEVLKQAPHPIQDDSVCIKRLAEYKYSEFNSKTMICAGSLDPLQGVCHGDSGGPLVCKVGDEWNIIGVASFVTDGNGELGLCGLRNQPSVFNKVSEKVDWISTMISKYS